MDFFNNLGKTLGKTAKNVTKKSEELVEITKINLSINSEEDKIKKLLLELGSEFYGRYTKGEGTDESLIEKCTQIKAIEGTIEALKEKVKALKAHDNSPEGPVEETVHIEHAANNHTEVKSDVSYRLNDNDPSNNK